VWDVRRQQHRRRAYRLRDASEEGTALALLGLLDIADVEEDVALLLLEPGAAGRQAREGHASIPVGRTD
jgi:hypothetical protein